jgi:hypothetical protein
MKWEFPGIPIEDFPRAFGAVKLTIVWQLR